MLQALRLSVKLSPIAGIGYLRGSLNSGKYHFYSLIITIIAVGFVFVPAGAWAVGDGEWISELVWDFSYFPEDNGRSDISNNSVLTYKAEYYEAWNEGADSFAFVPMLYFDQSDPTLDVIQIAEASWIHVEDTWEVRTGIRQVSWGVVESFQPVNIINQTNFTGSFVNQSTLGQPMINFSTVQDWGILDLYILFGFEEQVLPGPDSRLAIPIELDEDETVFPRDDRQIQGLDYAARWQHSWGGFEWALSYFNGRSRDPDVDYNYDLTDSKIVATYHLVQQVGLELLYIWNGWTFKFEAAAVDGQKERGREFGVYTTAAAGVENSFNALFGSNIDLIWFVEYLYDQREDSLTAFFEHDVFAGGVFNFNDAKDTNIFTGAFWDVRDDEGILVAQASRRLNQSWKLSLTGAYFAVERKRPKEDIRQTNQAEFVDDITSEFTFLDESNLEKLLESFSALVIQNGFDSQRVNDALDELFLISELAISEPDNKLGLLENESTIAIQLIHYF